MAKADSEVVVAPVKTQETETEAKIEEQAAIPPKVDDAPQVKGEEKEKKVSFHINTKQALRLTVALL